MGLRKRLFTAACVLAAAAGVIYAAESSNVFPGVIPDNVMTIRPTITLWYTDETLEDYLASVALDYLEAEDVRVIPVLKSGLEYLEAVNQASLAEENPPDLYIVSNDSLEKAYLAGLASEILDSGSVVTTENFPQTALDAVCYQGKLLGYPLYYEAPALVYNKTYLSQAAEEMEVKEQTLIPKTIDDILAFADTYNAPETVEAVFKWDVKDIFYNYFFAGNYINVGGPCGDDASQIDIYNLEAVKGLKAYQDLSQFFSIDAETSSYEQVVTDFLAGKLVFTVATTDIMERIATAREAGEFPYEYDVVPLPDVSEEVVTRGLSVTSAAVINGYSRHKELANGFAAYLADTGAEKLYVRTGHPSAKLHVDSQMVGMTGFDQEYALTAPMPKLMSTANYWVQMEIACTKIWGGENVSDTLKKLSEEIMTQVTGTEYVEEEYIEVPTQEETEVFEDEGMD